MSDNQPRASRIPRPESLALPIAFWQEEVERARTRVTQLRSTAASSISSRTSAFEELSVTFEELSVADEELRAQNDELSRTQLLLAADTERYRELFKRAPVAYLVTDPRGGVLDSNESASRLLRCRSDRLIGKPIVVFTQDASRRRVRALMRTVAGAERSMTAAITIVNRRGLKRRVEATVAPARDSRGKVVELRWLLVDRTRQARGDRRRRLRSAELEHLVEARTAELAHAQAVKDRLVATVSHEIRTALSAIGGYTEMLEMGLRGPLSPIQTADIRRIHHAYEHMSRVVDDLLSYSTLTAGKVDLDICDVSVAGAIAAVEELLRARAATAGVSLEVDPGMADVAARADADRLRQVLLNLAGNAVKFTPRGGHVFVRSDVDERHVRIVVLDDGVGVPDREREAVFEPFVRLRTQTGAAGTGLGLAISRDLARAMGGDVTLESSDGPGSKFVLRLVRSMSLAPPDLER
jgi:PAS domain S-box-containing protein